MRELRHYRLALGFDRLSAVAWKNPSTTVLSVFWEVGGNPAKLYQVMAFVSITAIIDRDYERQKHQERKDGSDC